MNNLTQEQPKKLRSQRLSLRTTKDEKEIIEWAAHKRKMSLSDYMRLCALKEAGHVAMNQTVGEPCE